MCYFQASRLPVLIARLSPSAWLVLMTMHDQVMMSSFIPPSSPVHPPRPNDTHTRAQTQTHARARAREQIEQQNFIQRIIFASALHIVIALNTDRKRFCPDKASRFCLVRNSAGGSLRPILLIRLSSTCWTKHIAEKARALNDSISLSTGAADTKYNYAEVLQKSILFYEAQRSGKPVSYTHLTLPTMAVV